MSISLFPHPLDYLPRPGMREIRMREIPILPRIRNERCKNHAAETR